MELKTVKIDMPRDSQLVVGTSHFIKTTEDLAEAIACSVPGIKYGLAFCESSGPCLVRTEGNDEELREAAGKNGLELGAGHSFLIFLRGAYPINILNAVKAVPEVCTIHCATANPIEIVVAETDQGRAILGVVDGFHSKGVETTRDIEERRGFLRKMGYKLK
ncbi:MAG: adenosine-specific kinase [archaeon]